MDGLAKLDVTQLRTFQRVYRLMSFTAAAEELDVRQSTISYAIGRLREAFNDPLFVRQGAGIAATERCHALAGEVGDILNRLEGLTRLSDFDPATTDTSVTISCNTYERLVLLPPILRRIRKEAPGLRLNLITALAEGSRQLLRGDADLVISPVDVTESGIRSKPLMWEQYVSLVDRNNPLAEGTMDAQAYLAARHIVVHYGGAWRSPYLRALEAAGHRLNRMVSTPSPADVPNLLSDTDLIATVPSGLAQFFDDRVQVLPCPFPAPFDIHIHWAARSDSSPVMTWLRKLTEDAVTELNSHRPQITE